MRTGSQKGDRPMSFRTLVVSTVFLLFLPPSLQAQAGSPDPESLRPIDLLDSVWSKIGLVLLVNLRNIIRA